MAKKRIRTYRLHLTFPTRQSLDEWFAAAQKRGLIPRDAELHGVCSLDENRAEFAFQGQAKRQGGEESDQVAVRSVPPSTV